jgi:hypothetical protein
MQGKERVEPAPSRLAWHEAISLPGRHALQSYDWLSVVSQDGGVSIPELSTPLLLAVGYQNIGEQNRENSPERVAPAWRGAKITLCNKTL